MPARKRPRTDDEKKAELARLRAELQAAIGGPKRKPEELRKMSCDLGVLARADGSARYAHEGTSMLAAAYGPVEALAAEEQMDRAGVEVIMRPMQGLPGNKEREQEQIVKGVLEQMLVLTLHPRCMFTVIIQVMSEDGAILPVAINAAVLALLDSGAPMQAIAAAVGCCFIQGQLVMDPAGPEEKQADAVASLVFENRGSPFPLAASNTTGRMTQASYLHSVTACREAAAQMIQFFKVAVKRKIEASVDQTSVTE